MASAFNHARSIVTPRLPALLSLALVLGAAAPLAVGCDGGLPEGPPTPDTEGPPADAELGGSYALVLEGLGAVEGEAVGHLDRGNGTLRTLRPARQLVEVGDVLVRLWVSTPSLRPGRYPIARTEGEVLPNGCRMRTEAGAGEATLVLALAREGAPRCYPAPAVGEVEVVSTASGDVGVRFAFRARTAGPDGVPGAVGGRGTFALRPHPGRGVRNEDAPER